MRLGSVMFELGARPHPPRPVYRAYLAQSQIFVGIYWQSYGWVAPGEQVSGLEDEYRLSAGLPRLIYVKLPAPDREPRLTEMPSLAYRRRVWVLTVVTDRNSSSAISGPVSWVGR